MRTQDVICFFKDGKPGMRFLTGKIRALRMEKKQEKKKGEKGRRP